MTFLSNDKYQKYFAKNSLSIEGIINIYNTINFNFININNIDENDMKSSDKIIIYLVKTYFIYIKDYIKLVGFERYRKEFDKFDKNNNFEKIDIREFDALLSGMMFFYFSFLYVILFPNWEKTMPGIVKYNVLYLLIDHYFDDDQVDEKERKNNIKKLMEVIITEKEVNFENTQLQEAVKIYKELIIEYPQCKDLIKDLLFYEIESVKIQKNSTLDIEEYYKIAVLKGGYTMLVISALFENNEDNYDEAFLIGVIMQLIDDSLDINEDNDNKINTYATKIKENGNIDDIFCDIFGKIKMIKNHNIIFMVFTILSCYLPNRYPENYSKVLFNITNYFNILPVKFPSYLLNYLEKNKISFEC